MSLAPGRTVAEVLETARRVFGQPQNIVEKSGNFCLCLCALKAIPGAFLTDEMRAEIRRVGAEVVRGAAQEATGGAK